MSEEHSIEQLCRQLLEEIERGSARIEPLLNEVFAAYRRQGLSDAAELVRIVRDGLATDPGARRAVNACVELLESVRDEVRL